MTHVDVEGAPVRMAPGSWWTGRILPDRMDARNQIPEVYEQRVVTATGFVTEAAGFPYSYWISDGPDSLKAFDGKWLRWVSLSSRSPTGLPDSSLTVTMPPLTLPVGGSFGGPSWAWWTNQVVVHYNTATTGYPGVSGRWGLGSYIGLFPYLATVVDTEAGHAPFTTPSTSQLVITDRTYIDAMIAAPWTIHHPLEGEGIFDGSSGRVPSFGLERVVAVYYGTLPPARAQMAPQATADQAYFT